MTQRKSAKKRVVKTSGRSAGATVLELLGPALQKATEALKDPTVRADLIAHGKSIAEASGKWREERRAAERQAPDARGSVVRRATAQFGQQKLEQRTERLRYSIDLLGTGRAELAAKLAPVSTALDQIALSLETASQLPLIKRKQAHFKIDEVLDQLERETFEASLPSLE